MTKTARKVRNFFFGGGGFPGAVLVRDISPIPTKDDTQTQTDRQTDRQTTHNRRNRHESNSVRRDAYIFEGVFEALVDISLVLEQQFPDGLVVQCPVNKRQLRQTDRFPVRSQRSEVRGHREREIDR